MRRVVQKIHPRGSRPLSVVEIGADAPGPTVVVTGNLHGDEVTGLLAVHALDRRLQRHLRAGAVRMYPSLNPEGLRARSRTVPDDGVDLNRIFPGAKRGGPSSRLAAQVWADILAREPAAVIDLHADATVAIPYTIVDRPVALRGAAADEMAQRLRSLADATGLTVLMEYSPAEYVRYGLDRSLAGAMVNTARVPALTLEVGPRGAVSSDAVEVAVQSVWGVLASLGLVDAQVAPHSTRVPGHWRRAPAPRVKVSGVFAPSIAPGLPFAAGDEIGTVRAVDGTIREKVTAPAIGVVVSWVDNAWVEPRAVVGTLGLEQQ